MLQKDDYKIEHYNRTRVVRVLYTGGTTGMPKGVMWPHKNLFYAALGGGGWFHPDGPISDPEQIAGRVGDFPIVGMALAPLMHGACWWYAIIQMLGGNPRLAHCLTTAAAMGGWQGGVAATSHFHLRSTISQNT